MALLESFKYPFTDEHWVKKHLIGGFLSLTALLGIPAIFLLGYQLRAMRHGLDGNLTLPSFKNWWELFKTGFAGTFIIIFYTLIGLPIHRLSKLQTSLDREFFSLTAVVVTVIFVYFLPAALANYLKNKRFRAGFYRREITDIALRKNYGINWLKGMSVFVVGSLLTQFLKLILVGFIAEFYLMVVLFYYFGRTIKGTRT